MKYPGLALCLLLAAGGTAHGTPADCLRQPLTPKPANIDQILKDHGTWAATRGTKTPQGKAADLSHHDLGDISLKDFDLRGAILTGAKLQGAKLDNARLDEAELTCVIADGASFAKANLFQAHLTNASLIGASFPEAKLVGTYLTGAELGGADFAKANMSRAHLDFAALRNTKLAESEFAEVDLFDALWQPFDLPKADTMGKVINLRTIKLDADNPDLGAMTRLVAALREAGLEDRAKEAAHARERALVTLDLAKWKENSDIFALGSAIFRSAVGWLTDYGLSLTRGLLIVLACNLAFALIYFLWGFNPARNRKTGIVTILPEKTVVSGPSGATLTTEDKVEPLAPASWVERLLWALCFAGLTAIRFGISSFNLLEILERLLGWGMAASGWLRKVANAQALMSLLLIGCLVYAYLL